MKILSLKIRKKEKTLLKIEENIKNIKLTLFVWAGLTQSLIHR